MGVASQLNDFYYEHTLKTVAFCLSEEAESEKKPRPLLARKTDFYNFSVDELEEFAQMSSFLQEVWNEKKPKRITKYKQDKHFFGQKEDNNSIDLE